MNILEAIHFLDGHTTNKTEGLPDEIFYFISRITPMVNVDLLIKDEDGRTLLSWRNDKYSGNGWHIPGGIVRYKETMYSRILKVAQKEIGTSIKFDEKFIAVNEIILPEYENRAHFISFLYKCYLPSSFEIDNKDKNEREEGFLKWHKICPENLISVQNIYGVYI
jgi:colanic acid biosynthesis protein WcaH